MASKLPVSLCMIVKDEEDFLQASLDSVKSLLGVSDIVIVDTGSTDRTKKIAGKYEANVFDFEWCDDFSAARNFSVDKAINDWIFTLDADEVLHEVNTAELESMINEGKTSTVGTIKIVSVHDNASSNISRFFNKEFFKWTGNIHEQITAKNNQQKKIIPLYITASHYGYTPEVKKSKNKFERNLRMLESTLIKQPNDPYLLAQIGKCYYVYDSNPLKVCEYLERALSLENDYRLEYIYVTVEYLGYSLLNTGQYEKALEHILKYKEFYNNKVEFRFLSAHVFQNNGMFQEAVECYESCLGKDISDVEGITSFLSYYNIGVIMECIGMLNEASILYKKCGDYEPALQRLKELAST